MKESYAPHHDKGINSTLRSILDVKNADTFERRTANLLLFGIVLAKESEQHGRHHLWQFIPDDPALWITKRFDRLKKMSHENPQDPLSDTYELIQNINSAEISDFPLIATTKKFMKAMPYHEEPRIVNCAGLVLTERAHEAFIDVHKGGLQMPELGTLALKNADDSSNGDSAA